MVNLSMVGNGKVVLIQGGGRCYMDMAARFCRTEKDLQNIIATEYDKNLVKRILESGHLAATEFDYFIFGVEGYSRVTEAQLIRKRHASYLIKSGRCNKGGKRSFDVVLPRDILEIGTEIKVPVANITIDGMEGQFYFNGENPEISVYFNTVDILSLIESWYNTGIGKNVPEEDLRYLKPQATEFKAIIGMNAHALLDWFKIRCCMNAQTEIRDMANKMLAICKEVSPDLFKNAGPSCKVLGYCPEGSQNINCDGKIIKKEEALRILQEYQKGK